MRVDARTGLGADRLLAEDFAGNPLFIRRTRDKFRWIGETDGMGVLRRYMTEQWHSTTQFLPRLPHEQFCHDALRESDELLRPQLHFAFRLDTRDRDIWQCSLGQAGQWGCSTSTVRAQSIASSMALTFHR